jgi:hypothetical protein
MRRAADHVKPCPQTQPVRDENKAASFTPSAGTPAITLRTVSSSLDRIRTRPSSSTATRRR